MKQRSKYTVGFHVGRIKQCKNYANLNDLPLITMVHCLSSSTDSSTAERVLPQTQDSTKIPIPHLLFFKGQLGNPITIHHISPSQHPTSWQKSGIPNPSVRHKSQETRKAPKRIMTPFTTSKGAHLVAHVVS